MNNPGRAVPIQTLKDVINHGIMTPDPQGSSANMFYSTVWKNGKMYNIEVLFNMSTNTIMHFQYTPKQLGPFQNVLQ